jgi:hypothetical protein
LSSRVELSTVDWLGELVARLAKADQGSIQSFFLCIAAVIRCCALRAQSRADRTLLWAIGSANDCN